MYGAYFMADYSLQWIKYALLDADGLVTRVINFATGMASRWT